MDEQSWQDFDAWAIWDGSRAVAEGLTLAEASARRGERSMLVPQRYLAGGIGEPEAAALARVELDRLVATMPSLHFGADELIDRSPMWFLYRRRCDEWRAQRRRPDALMAAIDRLDGHVWTDDAMSSFVHWQRG